MPISRRRKKKGKTVRGHGAKIKVDPDKESSVTLQDLINAVAWQESQKPDDDPTKMRGPVEVSDDVVVHYADNMPVYVGEGENRIQIGTADKIPGANDSVSIRITDPEVMDMVRGPMSDFSIDKEHDE
jgi:hypothetical protein